MRRSLLAVLVAGLLGVGLIASTATAAPTGTHLSIAGHAQLISPTTLLLQVTLSCPPYVFTGGEQGTGFVSVTVQSEETGGFGSGFTQVPCDGSPHSSVVVVNGGPFAPGSGIASGFGCGLFCDSDLRRIRIVV